MSQSQPAKISRREVLTASLGVAGAATVGNVAAAAQPTAERSLAGKRVLVGIGEFSEALETYYMLYRLQEEGVKTVVTADKPRRVQLVVHDFEPQYSNYSEKLGYQIQADIGYDDVNPAEFAGMLIPGGRGPEEMRQNKRALHIVRHFLDRDLPLGAMCHGPQVVYAAGQVKGRRMTAYWAIRPDVESAGAIFIDEAVVVDRKLVTSRGWPDLPYFMPKFLELLRGE